MAPTASAPVCAGSSSRSHHSGTLAWALVVAAVVLSGIGFFRYAQDGATNRDTSAAGLAMGWIGLVVLLFRLASEFPLPPEAYFFTGP